MEYAVNIVSRIISMHYHIPFDNAYEMLRTHGVLSIDKDSSYKNPKLLIMRCVEFIVNQCREREGGRGGKKVDQFVLLMDESLRLQQVLGDPYGNKDIHATLREALLTHPTYLENGMLLKKDLVMSSLGVRVLRATSSGRIISPLVLPKALDSSDIWDRWAPTYIPCLLYTSPSPRD